MHRYVPLAAVAGVLALGLASGALALTDADLRCQSTIGEAGREFAAARLQALVACNNQVVAGGTCDTDRRYRLIAGATGKLVRRIVAACSDGALADLGFSAPCYDPTPESFVVDDLTTCIEILHGYATDDAVANQYHRVQALRGDERRCQRVLGRAGSAFIAENMRARSRCLDMQLAGLIPEAVDCRADAQPSGPGTGDARTDRAIMRTTARLFSRIAEACFRADVGALAFPGYCPSPFNGPGVGDVQGCVRLFSSVASKQMLDVEYGPRATPQPSPSATPLPVSLSIAPKTAQKAVGGFQNFTITGHYADGTARNLTQRCEYFSSDESVAVAPNEIGNRSRVRPVGGGTALITATEPVTGLTSDAATLAVVECAHDVCVVGAALQYGCSACATAICNADPSCCADGWSQACVDAVASTSTCARSCTTSAD